jgi:BirA family biotin operon repressor/biotin-[acetyl-CoA-carboxylase] ligase
VTDLAGLTVVAMLSADELRAALGPAWRRVQVVAETGSTNADLLTDALADTAAPDRSVLVAESQTAGRGRLDRTWTAPPGTSLTFSVLIRPEPAIPTWGWLSLLTGVALQEAVVAVTGVRAGLKWPNDLLCAPESGDYGKAAGILAQTTGAAVVIGIGLNVTTAAADLPVETATSLALCGAHDLDRAALLVAILTRLDVRLREWTDAAGDAEACGLAAAYRAACLTLGQQVSITTTGGTGSGPLTGTATDVDVTGRLVLVTEAGTSAVAAGDVHHLRPRPQTPSPDTTE